MNPQPTQILELDRHLKQSSRGEQRVPNSRACAAVHHMRHFGSPATFFMTVVNLVIHNEHYK